MTPESKNRTVPETKSITVANIDSLLGKLKVFESDQINEEVERAIQAVHRLIDPRFSWFETHGIIVTYHGSLQYHDPKNLDVDLYFVGLNIEYEDVEHVYDELEEKFTQPGIWPRQPCDTNFGIASIKKIDEELKNFDSESNYGADAQGYGDFYPESSASYILSSALLYEEQRNGLKVLQMQIRDRLSRNRWLREGVFDSLSGAIQIREERRGLV